ncbi:MAG: hypothetical protein WDO24_22935 [Pseudomonadota bacterium]
MLKRVYSDYDFDATLQNYSTGGDPALGVARLYVTESIKQGRPSTMRAAIRIPRSMRCSPPRRTPWTQDARAKSYFKIQEILACDLPTITIHQQAEIDAATSQLQDVFLGANYVWWGSAWLKP